MLCQVWKLVEEKGNVIKCHLPSCFQMYPLILILFVMASIQQARCLLLSVIGKREGDRVRHKFPISQSFRILCGPTGKAGGMKWPSDGPLRQMNAGVLLSWHHQPAGLTVSRDSGHDRMPTWCWDGCFSKYIWAYHEDILTPPHPPILPPSQIEGKIPWTREETGPKSPSYYLMATEGRPPAWDTGLG